MESDCFWPRPTLGKGSASGEMGGTLGEKVEQDLRDTWPLVFYPPSIRTHFWEGFNALGSLLIKGNAADSYLVQMVSLGLQLLNSAKFKESSPQRHIQDKKKILYKVNPVLRRVHMEHESPCKVILRNPAC